jgi:hypothetical protein
MSAMYRDFTYQATLEEMSSRAAQRIARAAPLFA